MPLCTTAILLAALADIPAGQCALMCELRRAFIAVEDYDTGKAMLRDGGWFTAHRVGERWFLIVESELEQCQRGGFAHWRSTEE